MEPEAPAAVLAELQRVLEQACEALGCQEEGRLQEAVQGFFLARSRVRYVAEALLRPLLEEQPGDGGLALTAAACTLLEDTYSQAVERLTRGGGLCSADSSHDAEGTRNTGEEEEEGEEGAAGGGLFGAQRRSAGAGLLEARGTAGAGRQQQAQERRRLSAVAQECVQEVAGSLDEVELREAVLLPMRFPQLFTGIRRPQCNLLFHGAPGTGKTMLVEKLAAEAGTPLLCLSPAATLSKWAGESEKRLRAAFQAAAALSPAILFIDEVDSLAPARGAALPGGLQPWPRTRRRPARGAPHLHA
ncbi:hypothetical protein CHLNCDRAFT_144400 [Chlorella variabilis]|uniref:AAA+ ATPase domain-containing protein n=1 Tax=Chlorella variabilis TaxID=554065 RepID=E1ZBC9_CHLVA|nr:hypothetical protein CHLNCDRAFT_144400 [Chlorella variabilis]EFN56624.1 hypothetical protein CHLNCDRAFT_144400 [Chlorella variabilis]|eukprot:XP_005848726.1 hypothetical protein CHLNCDRAFT_144400 [Chlorella variabilis]